MKKNLKTIAALGMFTSVALFSQAQSGEKTEKLAKVKELTSASSRKLKVTGYVQAQAEFAQFDTVSGVGASTKVSASTKFDSKIDGNDSENFVRYGIRRGRIKFDFAATENSNAVFQLDITEGGIGVKDVYYQLFVPSKNQLFHKVVGFKIGVFDRPFGNEISYSSSRRESPERSLVFQKLFPDERDLGIALMLAAPKNTALSGLKLNAGLFSGNGIRKDDNGKLDFIGQLKYENKVNDFSYGAGVSYYNGKTNNASDEWFTLENSDWNATTVEANQTNKREYYGFDAQISLKTILGTSNVRGEMLGGVQPSVAGDVASPKANSYNEAQPFNYNRKFKGGHIYFVQDISKTPLSFVFKYSYFDPNTEISGNNIRNKADLAMNTFGFGGLWHISSAVRLQAFYEINKNETSEKLAAYTNDVRDNLFTLRLQYKF